MENFQIYRDIQARTGGDIYIGVVGPVRTGKSTFIRRFMELVALPGMDEKMQKEVRDQLPLSGSGKMITTVEPKFIPREAVPVTLGGGSEGTGSPDRLRRLSGKRRCRKYRRRKRAYGENALVYKSHSISRSRQNGYRKSNPGAFHHWPCDHLRWQLRGNSKGKFRSGRGADSSRTEKNRENLSS